MMPTTTLPITIGVSIAAPPPFVLREHIGEIEHPTLGKLAEALFAELEKGGA